MATIVKVGESIEGNKIRGTSRKPVDYKGIILEKGMKVHKFIVKFNTKSSITEGLSGADRKIIENAKTSLEDEIVCEDALLRSIDKRFTNEHESNVSHTHGASSWSFTRQTNVMITRSHQEIENAIRNRELANQSKLPVDINIDKEI